MLNCERKLLLFILIWCTTLLHGGPHFTDWRGSHAGQTVFNFLTLPVSASQLSQGIVATQGNGDAMDNPFFPSASAFLSSYSFGITHLEWLMGLRKEYVGACFPLLDQGTLGFHSQVFTFGQFSHARDIDEYVSDPKAGEFSLGASFARQLIYRVLSVGIAASYIESRLDGEGGRGFNCTIDSRYKPTQWLSAHTYVRNLGSKVKYNALLESQPLQVGLSVALDVLKFKADTTENRRPSIALSTGVQKTIDMPLQIGTGLHVQLINQFALKMGYEHFYGHDFSLGGLSAGFSLNVKQYGVDGGWKYQSEDFGSVWAASVRYNTEEMIPKTALDFFKIALRYFKKKRYRPCIAYAKKALRLNPNMWKAHSLLTKALSNIHRERGTEIALIYTGNVQGQCAPLLVKGLTMGGLARTKTAIMQTQEEYPLHLTIDAGNMLTNSISLAKAMVVDRYFRNIDYDVACIGSGEVLFDVPGHCKEGSTKTTPFLCKNYSKEFESSFIDYKIISKGKYSIALIYAATNMMLQSDTSNISHLATTTKLIQQVQSSRIRLCHLRILVVDDTWKNIQYYAKNVPLVDLIFCNSLQQHFETPMLVESIPIFSAGQLGKYLGVVELRFNQRKKLSSYLNKLIPITDEIAPDPAIEAMVNKITLDPTIDTNAVAANAMHTGVIEGVFPFVSDRVGQATVHLKIMKKQYEFPLTPDSVHCFHPEISFVNRSIMYLADHPNKPGTSLMIMDLAASKRSSLDVGGSVKEALFTPDEKWIYASVIKSGETQSDIYRIHPGGSEPQPIITWQDGSEQDISFSSDGINMLYTSNRDGTKQVYISDIMGNTPLRLTDELVNHSHPRFSPDNQSIAFLSQKSNITNANDLWVYNRKDGNLRRLTKNAGVQHFLWLDNKGTILYSSGINLYDFNTLNSNTGKNEKFIQSQKPKNYSELYPRLITYKKDERIIYERQYINGDKKVYWVKKDGTDDRQVIIDRGNSWLR